MTGGKKSVMEREAEALLLSCCRGLSSCKTIEFLFDNGLISPTASKAFLVREGVERLVRKGIPKMRAMEMVAEATHCSYGTVRGYVYNQSKTI